MRTGLQSPVFSRNRIVAKEDLAEYGLEYWRDTIHDFLEDVLYPEAGVFQSVNLIAAGTDKFSVSSPPSPTGMADGHILDVTEYLAYCTGVQFENANGIDYHVALGATIFPEEVEISPLDGQPRIKYLKEIIGSFWASPGGVIDNLDGTLTMVVDTVAEVNVSNAGRWVLVLKYPTLAAGATEPAIAWQICQVSWSGTQNEITTSDSPAGAGYFGQTTPSTTNGDYKVCLLGPYVNRNTDLSGSSNWAYLGTVTGTGAGNPPAVFDITGQNVYGTSGLAYLSHITRIESVPPDRLKIDVKAHEDEENTNTSQLRVTGWDGVGGSQNVFDVDELGNVTIEGDLTVQGETSMEDLVQINSSETITDNLTAGDADTDAHVIKGNWSHTNAAETEQWFIIDRTQSGHVGIGAAADATYHLNVGTGGVKSGGDVAVTGDILMTGDVDPTTPETRSLGDATNKWGHAYIKELHLKGAADPALDFWDESEATDEKRWGMFVTGGSFFLSAMSDAGAPIETGIELQRTGSNIDVMKLQADAILLNPSNVTQTTTDFEPNTPGTLNCGDSSNYWSQVNANALWARGDSGSDSLLHFFQTDGTAHEKWWKWALTTAGNLSLYPVNDSGVDGTAAVTFVRGTANVTDSLNFGASLFPLVSGSQELGGTSNEWGKLHLADDAGKGIADNLVPAVAGGAAGNDIGNADYRWRTIYGWTRIDLKGDSAGGIEMETEDTGGPADMKIFSITNNNGVFTLYAENDSSSRTRFLNADMTGGPGGVAQELYLRSNEHLWLWVEPVGDSYIGIGKQHDETEADTIQIHYPLIPKSGVGANIGTSSNQFGRGYFTIEVEGRSFKAKGDPGSGIASTVHYTNGTSGINDVANGTIRLASAANNTGWLKIWDGITARYIPFFDAI